jgi:sugar phosphate isomerase/epimerase
LALSTAGLLGLPTLAEKLRNKTEESTLGKIALQLYTVRREISKDLNGTLEKVADIGFTRVETAFWPEHITLNQASKALRSYGLQVCSVHCELPFGQERSKMLELADAYQCEMMVWHGWPEDPRYQTHHGIKKLADIYNESNQFARQNGLRFGLHNHWWEFRNRIDGKYPYQILKNLIDPDIFFELDTYWLKVAGFDPAEIVGQFADKAPLLHIKDGPARYTESLGKDEPEPMVAVGQGVQDFPAIVKAARGHTKWMIVEMDKTETEIFQAIKESYHYLIDNKLAHNN